MERNSLKDLIAFSFYDRNFVIKCYTSQWVLRAYYDIFSYIFIGFIFMEQKYVGQIKRVWKSVFESN